MSRTRKGKQPTVEFQSNRPGNRHYTGLSGRIAKTLTHRRERIINKRLTTDPDGNASRIRSRCWYAARESNP